MSKPFDHEDMRDARRRLGLSGAALANALHVTERTIRAWENPHLNRGKGIPPLVGIVMRAAVESRDMRLRLGIPSKGDYR